MICKMFTINGKAPTIGNTALTGSAIADPGMILEYSGNPSKPDVGYFYDGITVRSPEEPMTGIDYSNIVYYSDTYYESPSLSQVTKAIFVPSGDLNLIEDPRQGYADYALVSKYSVQGQIRIFPYDLGFHHIGAYFIPPSAYIGKNLYVYFWIPDVLNAPEHNDQVGFDCTTIMDKTSLRLNILKAEVPGALNDDMFNQTYVDKIFNMKVPSAGEYFCTGRYIEDFNSIGPVSLVSASEITQYTPAGNVLSAYKSKLDGFSSITYAEDCDLGRNNGSYFSTIVTSAKNSTLNNVYYKSANNCNITVTEEHGGAASDGGSAYNSTVNFALGYDNSNRSYYNNCNITETPQWPERWAGDNCNVTSTQCQPIIGGMINTNMGTWKNSYWTYGGTTWYLEDFPTIAPVPL